VAVSGDGAVIGAKQEDSGTTGVNSSPNEIAPNSGAAYIFARIRATWSQQAYLKASNTQSADNFGSSVAMSGATVVVGAPNEDSGTIGVNSTSDESAREAGAAYIFTRSDRIWSQQAYLKAGNSSSGDQFGVSVAASGATVVVGAPSEDSSTTGVNSEANNFASDSGAVYVFTISGTVWGQHSYLKARNSQALDKFGSSVTVFGDLVVTGAPQEDSSRAGVNGIPDESAPNSGAVYIFNGLPVPPTLAPVTIASSNINPTRAKLADKVILNFTASEPIQTPIVTLLGVAATVTNLGGNNWMASAYVDSGTMEGKATFSISAGNLAGDFGASISETTDASNVTVDMTSPTLSFSQTISFTAPSTVYLGQSPLALNAYATSGLPVTLSVVSGPATLAGNILALTGTGTVKVQATQAGGENYKAAAPVTRSLIVKADPAVLTLVNLNQPYDSLTKPVAAVGATEPVTLSYKIGGVFGSTPPTNAGSYAVQAVSAGVTKSGTLIITKAPLFITPDDQRKFVGQPNPSLTLRATGYQGSDAPGDVLTKPVTLTTTAKTGSPGGLYPIKSNGGASANYALIHRPGTLVVESFAGQYEALLVDGFGLPVDKLNVTVASTDKSFSGKLLTASESNFLSFSGSVTTELDFERCSGTAFVTKNGARYDITFTAALSGEMSVAVMRESVPQSSASNGRKLLDLPSSTKVLYSGTSTVVLEPALPADETVPVGAGWAQTTTSAKGVLMLKGKLGDGTAFTAALSPDGGADPGYRLFVQPYKAARSGAYLAGSFRMEVSSSAVGAREMRGVGGAQLTWVKAGLPADPSYRTSFGPVTTTMTLNPWLKPAGSNTLGVLLGLTGGTFRVEHSDTESLSDPNLPSSVALSAKNVVSVLLPATAPPNITKWKTTINASLGTFTGSFELLDVTQRRMVPFSGVLRQPASSADNLIGDGHFLLPALNNAPSTEKVSGEILFSR
jgi:hypothetical protein